DVEARLAVLGARLALRVVDQLETGTAHGRKQDPAQVTKAPKLKKEHGLIDWTRSAAQVCNHIRAMQPSPTAYTYRHREGTPPLRLILYRATWRPREAGEEVSPGQVFFLYGRPPRLCVGAGDGNVVEVLELQPAGKRRMSAEDFLHGHRLQPWDRLGPEA